MKLIIDLIEDIRTGINNDKEFSLVVMGLEEKDKSVFVPSWQSGVCSMKLDEESKKLFIFLGKEEALRIGGVVENLNHLSNEKMMYEVCVSYLKEGKRFDSSLLGFGESLQEKKYLLFIPK